MAVSGTVPPLARARVQSEGGTTGPASLSTEMVASRKLTAATGTRVMVTAAVAALVVLVVLAGDRYVRAVTAAPVRPCLRLFLISDPALSARPADGYLQPVGQRPAIPGTDGALRVAVRGYGQHDDDVAVGVRFDHDRPADVAGRVQA